MFFLKKLFSIFDIKQLKNLLAMQFMVIFIALFEVIGIASIAPFMAVVATPESINTNKYLRFIFDFFTCETSNEFLVILGGIVFGFILIGNVLNLGMRWFMIYSGYQIGRKLEVRLFKSYLSEDYFFHTQKNSSILTKNIVHEVVRLTHNIVVQLLTLNARFFTILFIMIGLIVVNYKVTLVASILYGISYILIYSVIRRKLTLNSKKASKYSGKKYQIISEALGGIKELKLHGKEELYVNDYDGVSEKCVHVTTYNTIIVHISRSFLEIMSFGIIISAVVFLVKSGQKITDFLPLLSLFAMAGLRLIPSLQQLFASITVIKANTYSLDLTFEDLKKSMQAELTKEKEIKRAPYPLVKSLKLSNVDYRYSGTHQNVLNELNIEVNSNTSIGIVGPTGAGKSTLVDIILGLLKPTSGDLIIDGNKISTKEQLKKWQASIGYVPQSIYLLDNTIAKNIAFTLEDESIDQVRLQDAARLAQLEEFILSKPDGYQTFVGERGVQISGGQRQRIGIARALYQSPSILIFDEATSALDNVTEKSIMMAINKLSKDRTIIMIAHRLTTVKDCDLILFLKNGRVTSQGSFDELVQTNSEFRKMLEA